MDARAAGSLQSVCSGASRRVAAHWHVQPRAGLSAGRRPGRDNWRPITRLAATEDSEPDWDAEMSIFKQRIARPNQLGTLRRIAERADVGKVLYCEAALAIVEGLVNDAEVGTSLSFASGAAGVLLWRRSDNICYVLVLQGPQQVAVGEAVQSNVKGILQVVDDEDGPQTKREFDIFAVPAGDALQGAVVDFLGRPCGLDGAPTGHGTPLGGEVGVPLLNPQLGMECREQIHEPLFTQIMPLDTLTPLGRGQALLVTGPPGGLQSDTGIDAVLGQAGARVRCVYAAVGKSRAELSALLAALRDGGAMEYTTVVVAPEDAPLGERYAALCSACAIAERTRDAGGHALVVLDEVSSMVQLWERITSALAGLGLRAMELEEGDSNGVEEGGEEALVEYEGMLVSAAAAQRRRFFSSLIQRAAKVSRQLGGGSMTLLPILLGSPATGVMQKARDKISGYQHLSEQQKAKLLAALDARSSGPTAGTGAPSATPPEGSSDADIVRTEVVEEWMSITDGQIVQRRSSSGDAVCIDPAASVSRIGSRALPPAMAQLAPAVRFELAQAADAERFAAGANDAVAQRKAAAAARIRAVLEHIPRRLTPLEEQAVMLFALQGGFVDNVSPDDVPSMLRKMVATIRTSTPTLLDELAATKRLSAEAEAELAAQLNVWCTLMKG